jgi:hypothetical protein
MTPTLLVLSLATLAGTLVCWAKFLEIEFSPIERFQ